MDNIFIEASTHTPTVEFESCGKLKLTGRSFPEDPSVFYDPLIEFVTLLDTSKVILDVDLEYFNTASTKKLMDLFKHLDANRKINQTLINWHYEEGDDDSVETAEIFEESLMRTEFRYHEYEEEEAEEE